MKDNLYYRSLPFEAEEMKGSFDGIKLEDGYLCLDGVKEGTFVSEPISVPRCNILLVSWNAYRRGGSVELWLAYKKEDGSYSQFFSYGVWGTVPASKSCKMPDGTMDEDTLFVNGETDTVIVKAVLSAGEDGNGDPRLMRFAVCGNGKPYFTVDRSALPEEVFLDVKPRSQMIIPKIGNIICSPTSTSMCMDYKGVDIPHDEFAAMCFDHGAEIYGNWLFNIAAAAEQGLHTHYDMYDVDAAMHCLANGTPLPFSIRTKEGELTNAPQAYPAGHLICVIGYKTINGRLHFIVNDPASKTVEGVRREYDAEELDASWKLKSVYIVR